MAGGRRPLWHNNLRTGEGVGHFKAAYGGNGQKRSSDTSRTWLPQAAPHGIPFDYVMQPCDVKLRYLGMPWYTVKLEVGHNEIGDADECEMVEMPNELKKLFDFLAMPQPSPIPVPDFHDFSWLRVIRLSPQAIRLSDERSEELCKVNSQEVECSSLILHPSSLNYPENRLAKFAT